MGNSVVLADNAVKQRGSVLRVGHGDVYAFREQPLHQNLQRKSAGRTAKKRYSFSRNALGVEMRSGWRREGQLKREQKRVSESSAVLDCMCISPRHHERKQHVGKTNRAAQ